jgi:hypothetical protein
LVVLVMSIGTGLAKAQNIRSYTFLVGSGFLCDSSDSTCGATARATRGDSYEFSGAGSFDAQDKSVKAAGTFTHKSANGHVLETGVWIASDLVSFVSYGAAPGALLRETSTFGPKPFDPMRMKMRMLSEPMPTGGLAVFRVRLLSAFGVPRNAILQAICALGDVPPEHPAEGVQLTIDGNGGEYSEPVSGRVMFLALPSAVSSPTNGGQREPSSGGTEIRRN